MWLPTLLCASWMATVSAWRVELPRGTTRLTPMLTRAQQPRSGRRSKMAAPKGPPVPSETLRSERWMASDIISASLW